MAATSEETQLIPVQIMLPKALWDDFKIQSIREDRQLREMTAAILQDYLGSKQAKAARGEKV